jgi:UDP-glucose 4-epimerase
MAAATQEPLNIFVPLDTIRDYIYVDDAAAMALHWARVALDEQPEAPVVRIIASGDAVTVGQLIRTMRVVTKRRIPIALGSHPSSASQALDLRLTPSGTGDLEALPATPLPAGVKAVYLDILRRLQRARPTGPAPHAPR